MFGRKLIKKNAEQYPERKLNLILLFAKYYLYNTKLTHGEISMPDFITRVDYKYSLAVMCNQVECRLFKCGVNWPEYMYGTTIFVSLYHVQKVSF